MSWKTRKCTGICKRIGEKKLRINCLQRQVIEGKVKGGIEVTGRRGRRRRKVLDDLKGRRGSSHLKEEALHGVSNKVGEWYQKINKTEDTNKLTLLTFKIIAILHNTLLATFIKLHETVSKGLFRNRLQNQSHVHGLTPRLQNVRLS
jgi:hypothetical protein